MTKLVSTDLREHPAVQAWRQLGPQRQLPNQVEILKGRREQSRRRAFRLVGVGRDGAAVIAKRTRNAKAVIEHAIYDNVLPRLLVRTLGYYGRVIEPGTDYSWLFLEDAGPHKYCAAMAEHRRIAGRWLGLLHAFATRVAAPSELPELGSGHYLMRLRSARDRIEGSFGNSALTADDREALAVILSRFDDLERRWDEVKAFCDAMPRTLNHGDLVAKNMRIGQGDTGIVLLPFDWGSAGRGAPALDLAQCAQTSGGFTGNVDLAAYFEVVRDHWPGVELPAVRRWARLGTLFRTILAINWAARSLRCEWTGDTMAWIKLYSQALASVCRSMSAGH